MLQAGQLRCWERDKDSPAGKPRQPYCSDATSRSHICDFLELWSSLKGHVCVNGRET